LRSMDSSSSDHRLHSHRHIQTRERAAPHRVAATTTTTNNNNNHIASATHFILSTHIAV
jgi:hypothetical protein